jgi:hypothetical protein
VIRTRGKKLITSSTYLVFPILANVLTCITSARLGLISGEAEAKAWHQNRKANMLLLPRHQETTGRVRSDER